MNEPPSVYLTGAPRTMPTDYPNSNPRSCSSSYPCACNLEKQETQVSLQGILIRFILHIISSFISKQKATRMLRRGSLIISYTGVHTVYYEAHALFSITKSWIYNKEEWKCLKVIISYKYVKDSNTSVFESARPIIRHSQVRQVQFESM